MQLNYKQLVVKSFQISGTNDDWKLAAAYVTKTVQIDIVSASVQKVETDAIIADLSLPELFNRTVYFVAPPDYLGKKLTSYGGALKYSIFFTGDPSGK